MWSLFLLLLVDGQPSWNYPRFLFFSRKRREGSKLQIMTTIVTCVRIGRIVRLYSNYYSIYNCNNYYVREVTLWSLFKNATVYQFNDIEIPTMGVKLLHCERFRFRSSFSNGRAWFLQSRKCHHGAHMQILYWVGTSYWMNLAICCCNEHSSCF